MRSVSLPNQDEVESMMITYYENSKLLAESTQEQQKSKLL